MTCVVVVDMRENNGQVCAIVDGDDEGQWLAQFPDEDAAEAAMRGHLLDPFPRFVVDIGPDPQPVPSWRKPHG